MKDIAQLLFAKGGNFAFLLTATVLLVLGGTLDTNVTMWISLVLFISWNAAFLVTDSAFAGRDAANLIAQTNQARAYLGALLPIYAALLGALFVLDKQKMLEFLAFAMERGLRLPYLLMPFIFAFAGLLFVPTQLHESTVGPETPGIRILFVWVVFCYQAAFFTFVHCALRLLSIFTLAV